MFNEINGVEIHVYRYNGIIAVIYSTYIFVVGKMVIFKKIIKISFYDRKLGMNHSS